MKKDKYSESKKKFFELEAKLSENYKRELKDVMDGVADGVLTYTGKDCSCWW